MGDLEDEVRDSTEQDDRAKKVLASALLPGPVILYLIDHDLWGVASDKLKESKSVHLQHVLRDEAPTIIAGKACTWLSQNKTKIRKLVIIAHGGPGRFRLGQELDYTNVAPLVGWLRDFFDLKDKVASPVIQIVGCNAGADSIDRRGGINYGQDNYKFKDDSLSHLGSKLLLTMARAANVPVEAPYYALSTEFLELRMLCRRAYPAGFSENFPVGPVANP